MNGDSLEPPLEQPRAPIQRKVAFATAGGSAGLGMGKAVAAILVAFGVVSHEQGEPIGDALEFMLVPMFTFLGGYLPRP